jgi:hypothetical protein
MIVWKYGLAVGSSLSLLKPHMRDLLLVKKTDHVCLRTPNWQMRVDVIQNRRHINIVLRGLTRAVGR